MVALTFVPRDRVGPNKDVIFCLILPSEGCEHYVRDASSGATIAAMSADMRGNTDESWSRTLDWLVRNRLLAPGHGLPVNGSSILCSLNVKTAPW